MARAREHLALVGIAITALLIRVWVILVGHPECTSEQLASPTLSNACLRYVGDMQYFRVQGHYLAKGHGYLNNTALTLGRIRPGAYHPPLFPTLLSFFNLIGIRSLTEQRIALGVIGALGVVLIGVVVTKVAGRHGRLAGLAAASIAAVCPLMWLNDTQAMSESVYVPLVVTLIAALYWFWRLPTVRRAMAIGLIVGLIGLTRAEGLSMLALMLPLLWGMRYLSLRIRVGLFAAAVGTTLVLLSPWVAYNLSRFPNTTYLTTSAGDALLFRSCDSAFYGRSVGYYDNDCGPKPNLSSEDESAQDLRSRKLATDYIGANLGRLPIVVAARIGRMWEVWRPLDNATLSGFLDNRGETEAHLALYSYYLMIMPAGFGVIALRRRRLPLSPVLGMFALVTFSTALTSAVVRYRASADVTLVLLAGIGIAELWAQYAQPRLAAGRRSRLGDDAGEAGQAGPAGEAPTTSGRVGAALSTALSTAIVFAFVVPAALGAAATSSAAAGPPIKPKPVISKSCERSNNLVLLYDAYDDAAAAEPAAQLRQDAPPEIVARIDQVVATHGDIVALGPTELMAVTKELSVYATDKCSLFGTK